MEDTMTTDTPATATEAERAWAALSMLLSRAPDGIKITERSDGVLIMATGKDRGGWLIEPTLSKAVVAACALYTGELPPLPAATGADAGTGGGE
jgi:hypothetical protein